MGRKELSTAPAAATDPAHLSAGSCSWDAPVEGMSMPLPELVLHPGGLANEAASHKPDPTRFAWPWRSTGRLISSWETSGKQAGGRSGKGAEQEGKAERTSEVTALGATPASHQGPLGQGCPGPASLSGMQHTLCHTQGRFPWGIRLD